MMNLSFTQSINHICMTFMKNDCFIEKKDKKTLQNVFSICHPLFYSLVQKSWFISIGFYDSVQKCSKGSLQVS